MSREVSVGPLADIAAALPNVRFTPKSGLSETAVHVPLSGTTLHADLARGSAYGPCSGGQVDAAVTVDWKIGAYPVAQGSTPVLREGHAVARRWRLSAKKWRPVIVKISKICRDIDWPGCDVVQTSASKEVS